jgi:2-polyprenyl-3-methyl-5-hydroxy-6-metoxy-1,4-benzoquinol methylase
MINDSRVNPNLDKLHEHFETILDKYFDGDKPIPEYFEEVKCYTCGCKEIIKSFVVDRFRHVRCKDCGMVYVNPRLKEAITHALYGDRAYDESYKIKLIPSIDYRRNVLGVIKFNQIADYFDRSGTVLDIGCGLGEVLSVFQQNNWSCTGIEFNEFAANYARATFNLNIVNRSIYEFDGADKYDLIMLWGVLEHFYDPVKILTKVNELLKDDGILVLEVPSGDSVLVRYLEENPQSVDRIIEGDLHIMLFSVRSFIEMSEKAGFEPISIKSNGLDISTLNRLFLDNALSLPHVHELQALLDSSLQGDLLRGFFRRRS